MFKTITLTVFAMAVSAASLVMTPPEASAYSRDYCREYTRTVYIGGRAQDAYGTACLQSDGSWMIVGEGLGGDIPSNASGVDYVIRDNNRYVTPNRVVYYDTRIVNRRVSPSPTFIWYKDDNRYHKHGRHVNYSRKWDRHDREDHRRHNHR